MYYNDFDLDGRVKVPVGFYLVLLYLLRGYFIWLMSLTHRQDPTLILSLVYNDSRTFLSALVMGITALIVYALFLSKGRIINRLELILWRYANIAILLTLLVDLGFQTYSFIGNGLIAHWSAPAIFILGVYLTWYWLSSKKIKRFFSNWLL
ncbi:DUF2919 family protein [Psychrosphaera aestuarii]|uniref:DUF2919 family protein n=1 Tax=Psychrosphaera aestuarii TaxID=1266052 RepID=UPI001B32D1CF|nr:DUF2919 family protein [Psychrosphaera aestuarii]